MSAAEGVEQLQQAMKRSIAVLREAEIPHMLGGGFACWARGGPETFHDVDLMIRPDDAQRALDALAAAGFRTERPPEEWLVKAYDGECLIDLIYEPSGLPIDDSVFDRADELQVLAVRVPVMALEDVLVTKLASIREHEVDFSSVLEIARALRERIDWDDVRRRAPDSAFVKAFFVLVAELGILPEGSGQAETVSAISRSSDTPVEKSA
jgi:hypothetical protein